MIWKLCWFWCRLDFLQLRVKAQLMWYAGSPLSNRKEVSNPELQDNGLQSCGVYAWKTCHWCRTETCLSWPFTWCNLTGPIAHLKGRRWKMHLTVLNLFTYLFLNSSRIYSPQLVSSPCRSGLVHGAQQVVESKILYKVCPCWSEIHL